MPPISNCIWTLHSCATVSFNVSGLALLQGSCRFVPQASWVFSSATGAVAQMVKFAFVLFISTPSFFSYIASLPKKGAYDDYMYNIIITVHCALTFCELLERKRFWNFCCFSLCPAYVVCGRTKFVRPLCLAFSGAWVYWKPWNIFSVRVFLRWPRGWLPGSFSYDDIRLKRTRARRFIPVFVD